MDPVVDSGVVGIVVQALTGPAAAMILLAGMLFGIWKLAIKALEMVSGHLSKIEELFSESKEELKNLNERVHDLANSLDKHIVVVDTRLNALEDRLERYEDRKE